MSAPLEDFGEFIWGLLQGPFKQTYAWYSGRRDHALKSAFIEDYRKLSTERQRLAWMAYELPGYENGHHLPGVPFLCEQSWIPDTPILLLPPGQNHHCSLNTRLGEPVTAPKIVTEHVPRHFWVKVKGKYLNHTFKESGYVKTLKSIAGESIQFNGLSYRVREINSAARDIEIVFDISDYESYQNTGEYLCFEFAQTVRRRKIETSGQTRRIAHLLHCRNTVGGWSNFGARHGIAGINNLTIIKGGSGAGDHSFLMMRRDNVQSAMNTYHVVPAGEFQPASREDPVALNNECRIWYTLLREFAEELGLTLEPKQQIRDEGRRRAHRTDSCGTPYDGTSFINDPPFSHIVQHSRNGSWRTYFLGVGVDPLSLKPEILTVSIIERELFNEIVDGMLAEFLKARIAEGLGQPSPFKAMSNRQLIEHCFEPQSGFFRYAERYEQDLARQSSAVGNEPLEFYQQCRKYGMLGRIIRRNLEGTIVGDRCGSQLDAPDYSNIDVYLRKDSGTLPAGMACLALAKRHLISGRLSI